MNKYLMKYSEKKAKQNNLELVEIVQNDQKRLESLFRDDLEISATNNKDVTFKFVIEILKNGSYTVSFDSKWEYRIPGGPFINNNKVREKYGPYLRRVRNHSPIVMFK